MRKTLLIFVTLILSACGGGGSSDGAGGENQQNNMAPAPAPGNPPAAQAVTYNGTATISLMAPGFPTINDSAPIQVVVQGNTVTLTVDGVSVPATLNNGMFSVAVPLSESSNGFTCNGSATVNGTVSGNTVSGNISGNATCTGNGLNLPVTLSGSFNAQS